MYNNVTNNKIKALLLLFLISSINSFAQEYKTPKAYIIDFSKNEDYVNNAMLEYSKSIISQSSDNRKDNTFDKLLDKLESINQKLIYIDKGYKNDKSLRDAFINLNNKVVYFLRNDFLNLKDYEQQSILSSAEIKMNLFQKEKNIKQFFYELKKYDILKNEFATKYNIVINTKNRKNVFEYNASQNFIFYKLNVLDGKLIKAIESKNVPDIIQANESLVVEANQAVKEIAELETEYKDKTLNNISKEFIHFLLKQSDELVTSAITFSNQYNAFQKTKKATAQSNDPIIINQYNTQVKEYNKLKNIFYSQQNNNQTLKQQLINAWFDTNSKFLMNNIDFEQINYSSKEIEQKKT